MIFNKTLCISVHKISKLLQTRSPESEKAELCQSEKYTNRYNIKFKSNILVKKKFCVLSGKNRHDNKWLEAKMINYSNQWEPL